VKLEIGQAGEPVLRRKAVPLAPDHILDDRMRELIEAMRITMHEAPGVGLAAPQIGLSIQLAVIEDPAELIAKLPPAQVAALDRRPVPFQVLINPRLSVEGEETAEFFEGCLSVAGFGAIVPRALRVRVDCLNENAEPVVIRAQGWHARILQHEIDHLNGILYVDRMKSRSFCTQDNHARLWKDRPVSDFWDAVGQT
jgi:peptide deformylase